jgi:hypothetical protein
LAGRSARWLGWLALAGALWFGGWALWVIATSPPSQGRKLQLPARIQDILFSFCVWQYLVLPFLCVVWNYIWLQWRFTTIRSEKHWEHWLTVPNMPSPIYSFFIKELIYGYTEKAILWLVATSIIYWILFSLGFAIKEMDPVCSFFSNASFFALLLFAGIFRILGTHIFIIVLYLIFFNFLLKLLLHFLTPLSYESAQAIWTDFLSLQKRPPRRSILVRNLDSALLSLERMSLFVAV